MESKKDEALRALKTAERHFLERNFVVAKRHAIEAQSLYPGLHGVSQLLASLNVYLAAEARVNGEIDYYSILGLKPTADDKRVANQFNRLSVLLQRNKNKVVGSDGALKLVSEAWSVLSDKAKRSAYDARRNKLLPSQNSLTTSSSYHGNAAAHFEQNHTAPVPHHRLDTFWTVCTGCKVQYEYLRKYLNKKLSCKTCRGVFLAVETGVTPVNGSYPIHKWSPVPTNGYAGNSVNGVPYYPSNSTVYTGNGVHLGHGSEHSSNLSFQWSSSPKTSVGAVIPSTLQTNGHIKVKSTEKRRLADQDKGNMKICSVQMSSDPSIAYRNPLFTKSGKIDKRRRVDVAADLKTLYKDTVSNTPCEVRLPYATTSVPIDHSLKASISSPPQVRRFAVASQFDIRNMLMDKAKKEIKRKLGEITLAEKAAAAAAADKNVAKCDENIKSIEVDTKSEPVSINVPDPDFHDFDKDRSEQCFKAKQVWALYDEEDGMPRLYCMIRQVISLDPFSMQITYLSSNTCGEFDSVDWVYAGFTKSCGNFKTMHSEIVDQVNIFSHVLSDDIKVGRGGRVRIYPRSGDIWAVYRNWSPDWDSSTPDEVKRQYDMVEVVNDYTEECGVHIFLLEKLEGYNTVYRRSANETAMRWIPKQEMFRFSHQVPSWLLEGGAHGLPDGCWDLDPAATPDDLLHSVEQTGATDESKTSIVRKKLGHHFANDVKASESSKCIIEPASEGLHHSDTRPGLVGKQLEPQGSNPQVKQDQPHDTKHAVVEPQQKLEEKLQEFNFADTQAAIQKVENQCTIEVAVAEGGATPDLNQKDHFHYLDECDSVEPISYTSENAPHPPDPDVKDS